MKRSVTAVIPARNETRTIEQVVLSMRSCSAVSEVIVVDNCSTDETAAVARRAGATVIHCDRLGMGAAMKAGIGASRSSTVFKIDADIRDPNPIWVDTLAGALSDECWFCSGYYESDEDEFPMNILVASPPLRMFFPELTRIRLPLSGTYAFNRGRLNWRALPDDAGFDVGLLVSAALAQNKAKQIPIGLLNDRRRRIAEYARMADEVLAEILRHAALSGRLDAYCQAIRSRDNPAD
jgi:glucosyl-3-phosphoglycerate synthase